MNAITKESRPDKYAQEYQRRYMRRVSKGIDWSIFYSGYTITALIVIPVFYQVLLLIKG